MGRIQLICLEILKCLTENHLPEGYEEIKLENEKVDHYAIKLLKDSSSKTYILYICNDDNLYYELTKNKFYGFFKGNKITFEDGECDKYFFDISNSIEKEISKYLTELDIDQLLCVGYSFGGTVASVITTKLNTSSIKNRISKGIKGYVFGNSPVFSGISLLRETKKYIKSIILNTDPTPKINAGVFNLPGKAIILNEFGDIATSNNQNNSFLDYGKLYRFGIQKYFTAIKIYFINKYDMSLLMILEILKSQNKKIKENPTNENNENQNNQENNEKDSNYLGTHAHYIFDINKTFEFQTEPETKQNLLVQLSNFSEQNLNSCESKFSLNDKNKSQTNEIEKQLCFEQSFIFEQPPKQFNFCSMSESFTLNPDHTVQDKSKTLISKPKSQTVNLDQKQKRPNITKIHPQNLENKSRTSNIDQKKIKKEKMNEKSINKKRKPNKSQKTNSFSNFDFKG